MLKNAKRIEEVINLPGVIALTLVGPGHGFAQLVFPMLFALIFYYAAFLALLAYLRRGANHEGD